MPSSRASTARGLPAGPGNARDGKRIIGSDRGANFLYHFDLGIQIEHAHLTLKDHRAIFLTHPGAVTRHL